MALPKTYEILNPLLEKDIRGFSIAELKKLNK